jgi:diacylglycerol O-acyltransferase
MTDYYPLSIVVHGIALNITVQSHVDQLCFGLIACRRAIADAHQLGGHLQRAMATLRALVAAGSVDAGAKREAMSAPAEAAPPPRAKRSSGRAPGETSRPTRRPRLRVVAPAARAPATAPAGNKAVKTAKPRKARPVAAVR